MSDQQINTQYEETFYIIPRRIRKLPGMTLAFLDVYETIFQFWNKHLPCYLSNASIQKRANVSRSHALAALAFFEKNGVLIRKYINGKRYLIQPTLQIETDDLSTGEPDLQEKGSGDSDGGGSGGLDHNIKKDLINNIMSEDEKSEGSKIKQNTYQETYFDQSTQHNSEYFEIFWEDYPIKKNKNRALAIWISQNCEKDVHEILFKLDAQLKEDAQYIDGYAPNPCNYLLGERWKDEIQKRKPKKSTTTEPLNHESNWHKDFDKDAF